MAKPVILTGIRANNDLHIGNYFGAMLPMVDMAKTRADEFQVNLFIPDLHSFTTPINHDELHGQIFGTAKLFAAAGLPLDNPDIHMYRQSYVPAHSELTWILDCFTGFGEMSRMTQFKDKSMKIAGNTVDSNILETEAQSTEGAVNSEDKLSIQRKYFGNIESRISVGLFNYPVLMAADYLLYGASYVPVGDDQTQHLEYGRDIAQRINAKFGDILIVPEPVKKQHEFFGKDQGLRIKDLADPTKKMSKSDETGKGVIFLNDDPEVAAKKIMSATTDDKAFVAFDPLEQPGISNLLQIHALLSGEDLEKVIEHHNGDTNYGDFKRGIAEQVKLFLTEFQAKLANVNDEAVAAKLESSEKAMNLQANATLLKVQQAVGLRPRA